MRLLSYFTLFYSFIVYFIQLSFLIRMMRWWIARHQRQRDNEAGDDGADKDEAGNNGAGKEEAGNGGVDKEEAVMGRAYDNGRGGGMQRRDGGGGR